MGWGNCTPRRIAIKSLLSMSPVESQILVKLLLPIARYCLRRSIRIQEVSRLFKEAFLSVAREELERSRAEISQSKLSAMTGIQRRDISKRDLDKNSVNIVTGQRSGNLIERIIGFWRNSPEFCNSPGRPRVLSGEGKKSEFAELVYSVSKDLNPYTVLFELQRLGCVVESGKGLKLVSRSLLVKADKQKGLELLAADTSDLFATVEENLDENKLDRNLHLRTEFDNISSADIEEIREWLLAKGSKFHQEVEQYLSKFDRDINPDSKTNVRKNNTQQTSRTRVVLGSFGRIEVDR